MIVSDTNLTNNISYHSQKNSINFKLPLSGEDKQLNNVNQQLSLKTSNQPQTTRNKSSSILMANKYQSLENNNFKQKLSLPARLAIKEYEALGNIDIKRATSTMFGINEFA